MRRTLSCFILHLAIVLFSNPWQALAQGPRMATVAMRPYHDRRAVVAVKVNGAGPYDFMVDTGATITVVDTDLVDQLKLPIEGTGTIHSFAAASTVWRSTAREIMVGDLTVKNVAIVSMKNPLLGSERPSIRGILGENFLHHFDLLIDNQHRQVTLDIGNQLAASLHGEHVVIRSTPTLAEQGEYLRPRLSVRIKDMGDTNVLLDSGANELIVFHWGNPFGNEIEGTDLKTINGELRCNSQLSTVRFSRHNVREMNVATCLSATVRPESNEGILPTAIFKKVFISHAGFYIIIDPIASRDRFGSSATVTARCVHCSGLQGERVGPRFDQ
jgi:predicted aspartyl protease